MKFSLPRIAIVATSVGVLAAGGVFVANVAAMLGWVVGAKAPTRGAEDEIREALRGSRGTELASAFREVIQRAPDATAEMKQAVRDPASIAADSPRERSPEESAKDSREALVSLLHSGPRAFEGTLEESITSRENLLDLALQVGEGPVQEYNRDAIEAAQLVLTTASPDASEDPALKQRRDQVLLRSQSVLLSMGENPSVAYEATIQALSHETDPAMREILRGQLEAQYPEFAPELTRVLGPPPALPPTETTPDSTDSVEARE